MGLVIAFSFVVLGLHAYITTRFPANISPEPELSTIPPLDPKPSLHRAASVSPNGADVASTSADAKLNGAVVEVEADASSRLRAGAEASSSAAALTGVSSLSLWAYQV